MSVWLTIPSKRPAAEVEPILAKWRERGYKIALMRDEGENVVSCDHLESVLPYPGYACAVNHLIRQVMQKDPQAEWFIAAGDDTEPDPNHTADEIAAQCGGYFYEVHWKGNDDALVSTALAHSTFGVMQPTGDRWHEGRGGFSNAPIDRVAGSAWIGREFGRRMYQGTGPLYYEYTHCFVDEELQLVAQKLGVFWQRRDLIHRHNNWARGATDQEIVSGERMPEFLKEANSAAHWRKYKALFEQRKAAGFPGHEPL